jgi:hypothetical protein
MFVYGFGDYTVFVEVNCMLMLYPAPLILDLMV